MRNVLITAAAGWMLAGTAAFAIPTGAALDDDTTVTEIDTGGGVDGLNDGDTVEIAFTDPIEFLGGGLAGLNSVDAFQIVVGNDPSALGVTFGANLPAFGDITFEITGVIQNEIQGGVIPEYAFEFLVAITDDDPADGTFAPVTGDVRTVGVFSPGDTTADNNGAIVTPSEVVIPVPAALPMFVLGLAGLGYIARRRNA